ncbi:hypothetical protein C1H76_3368 [Elsinoe australis]|uniref:PBP domain-containing protein n=1 Tax=Elsinoe australis TaxID=40998 RepID=A0A4U7B4N6_9PEZI|nr:hypothetical protein C1H76_3368 [Elsinoe australis]
MTILTSIKSHGTVDAKPAAVYGSGSKTLRIGNGGAGATGLIEALAYDYIRTRDPDSQIQWICNHSRNTQLALLDRFIDIALTYERDQELISLSEGWAKSAGCIFNDHFVLAGPTDDPAGIHSCKMLSEALAHIAQKQCLFHSRADSSATMFKERQLWAATGLGPWEHESTWYKTSLVGPAEALIQADKQGTYLLTDRSTLLRQTGLGNIKNLTVFFEPTQPGDVLMNACHALYSSLVTPEQRVKVDSFLSYLLSKDGQQIISTYGEDTAGLPLFASVKDGFAKTSLVGGRPLPNVQTTSYNGFNDASRYYWGRS